MTQIDLLYLALLVVYVAVDYFVFVPAFRRRHTIDPVAARRWMWSMFIALLSAVTVIGTCLWVYEGRDWQAIGLRIPDGWRVWGSVCVVLIAALIEIWSASKVVRFPRQRQAVRDQLALLGLVSSMAPRTRSDLKLCFAASITAGIGEEFIFRGYLIWAFHHWLPWWTAAAASLAVFSFGHVYQGSKGVLQSALAGACMTLLVGTFRSLLPAIAIHAMIDVTSSYMAYLALKDESAASEAFAAGHDS